MILIMVITCVLVCVHLPVHVLKIVDLDLGHYNEITCFSSLSP